MFRFLSVPPFRGDGGGYEDIRYRLYMILVMFMDRIDERPGRYPEGVGMRIFIQICVDKFAICFRAHCKYWCAVCCVLCAVCVSCRMASSNVFGGAWFCGDVHICSVVFAKSLWDGCNQWNVCIS